LRAAEWPDSDAIKHTGAIQHSVERDLR
jgi:hypothetical protein